MNHASISLRKKLIIALLCGGLMAGLILLIKIPQGTPIYIIVLIIVGAVMGWALGLWFSFRYPYR